MRNRKKVGFTLALILLCAVGVMSQHDRETDVIRHLNNACQSYIANNRKAEREQLDCTNHLLSALMSESWRDGQ